jgi:hypothetical protein
VSSLGAVGSERFLHKPLEVEEARRVPQVRPKISEKFARGDMYYIYIVYIQNIHVCLKECLSNTLSSLRFLWRYQKLAASAFESALEHCGHEERALSETGGRCAHGRIEKKTFSDTVSSVLFWYRQGLRRLCLFGCKF